jgi:hypothetical protein
MLRRDIIEFTHKQVFNPIRMLSYANKWERQLHSQLSTSSKGKKINIKITRLCEQPERRKLIPKWIILRFS